MKSIKSYLVSAAALLITAAAGPVVAQEITLRFTQPWPASHPQWVHGAQVFIDYVTEKTNGQVAFEPYHADQLGGDALALLKSGLADISLTSTGYLADRMPLSNVLELPGFFINACDANRKFGALLKEDSVLYQSEYAPQGIQPIYVASSPAASIVMGKKEINTLNDLKGMKLRASGSGTVAFARGVGAVPIQTVASELYDAIGRGTIDGAIYYYVGMPSFSLDEVFGTGLENVRGGAAAVVTIMRRDRWKALPENVREAMTEGGRRAEDSLCSWYDKQEMALREKMVAERGHKVTRVSADEEAKWAQMQSQIADEWAALMDSKGRKGTEVLEAYRAAE